MPLRFEIIDNLDDFMNLKPAWNELVKRSDLDFAFMMHEWFERWMVDFDRTDNLVIVTAYSKSDLEGIAPLRIVKEKQKNIPFKALQFMSSSISPRCNFILSDDINYEDFYDFIFNKVNGYDLIVTNDMQDDLKTTQNYINYLKSHKKGYLKDISRISPYVVLDTDWENYFKNLSKSYRRNIKQAFRNMNREGDFTIEAFDNYDDIKDKIDDIFSVSAKSWKVKHGTDFNSNKSIGEFYKNFSKISSSKKLWHLWALKLNGKYIAFDYCLKYNNRLTGLRYDFDDSYKKIMPGHILKVITIKNMLARNNNWEYDMGGNIGHDKLEWTDQLRNNYVISTASNKLYGKTLISLKKILRKVRNNNQPDSQ